MLDRLMSAALVTAAACAVMFCGTPEPKAEATPTVAKAAPVGPPPDQSIGKCTNCVCVDCKCKATNECKAKGPSVEEVNLCWACGGDKVLIDEATGKEEPCAACQPKPKTVPVVKAAPLYTHPQPVAKPVTSPSHARHIAITPRVQYVRQWRPNYGPLGRERGGQWVTVAVAPRQYQRQQPVYRYRSCSNGSCR
jgi:hypothetical protein